MKTSNHLADILALRPLDRVQVNNRHEIHEYLALAKQGYKVELPFFYFQRVLENGMLEVRSPGGYVTEISPLDACDVVRGEQVTVRAMPRSVFMARSMLSLAERQKKPSDDCYAIADVLYVAKDRWGGVDAYVWFRDAKHNSDKPIRAAVMDEDQAVLKKLANRSNMPVQNYRSTANHSADTGIERSQQYARDVVSKFIRASVNGDLAAVEVLSRIGDNKIGMAALNKMMRPTSIPQI